MLVCCYPAERNKLLQLVASSVEVSCRTEEGRRDVNQLVDNPVNHYQLCVDSVLLKCRPTKVVGHLAGTTGSSIVTFYESGSSPLDRL